MNVRVLDAEIDALGRLARCQFSAERGCLVALAKEPRTPLGNAGTVTAMPTAPFAVAIATALSRRKRIASDAKAPVPVLPVRAPAAAAHAAAVGGFDGCHALVIAAQTGRLGKYINTVTSKRLTIIFLHIRALIAPKQTGSSLSLTTSEARKLGPFAPWSTLGGRSKRYSKK